MNDDLRRMDDRALLLQLIGKGRRTDRLADVGAGFSLLEYCRADASSYCGAPELSDGQRRRLHMLRELHRRLLQAKIPDRPVLRQPEDIVPVILPLICGRDTEAFFVLPVNSQHRLIGYPIQVSTGDIDGTEAGPRAVMRSVLRVGAVAGIVVAHNHPSGDNSPSAADLAVTRRLVAAGRHCDVPIEDHIVLSSDGRFTSIRRQHPELFCGN